MLEIPEFFDSWCRCASCFWLQIPLLACFMIFFVREITVSFGASKIASYASTIVIQVQAHYPSCPYSIFDPNRCSSSRLGCFSLSRSLPPYTMLPAKLQAEFYRIASRFRVRQADEFSVNNLWKAGSSSPVAVDNGI